MVVGGVGAGRHFANSPVGVGDPRVHREATIGKLGRSGMTSHRRPRAVPIRVPSCRTSLQAERLVYPHRLMALWAWRRNRSETTDIETFTA